MVTKSIRRSLTWNYAVFAGEKGEEHVTSTDTCSLSPFATVLALP